VAFILKPASAEPGITRRMTSNRWTVNAVSPWVGTLQIMLAEQVQGSGLLPEFHNQHIENPLHAVPVTDPVGYFL
jgi:hypothetical protein